MQCDDANVDAVLIDCELLGVRDVEGNRNLRSSGSDLFHAPKRPHSITRTPDSSRPGFRAPRIWPAVTRNQIPRTSRTKPVIPTDSRVPSGFSTSAVRATRWRQKTEQGCGELSAYSFNLQQRWRSVRPLRRPGKPRLALAETAVRATVPARRCRPTRTCCRRPAQRAAPRKPPPTSDRAGAGLGRRCWRLCDWRGQRRVQQRVESRRDCLHVRSPWGRVHHRGNQVPQRLRHRRLRESGRSH